MCGICGIMNFDSQVVVSKIEIDRMVDRLLHRGPDATGFRLDGRVGLGHTRLSVIDLSKAASQPMSNEDGRIWITYNGEIYNFHDLRQRLESKGHRFKSLVGTIRFGIVQSGVPVLVKQATHSDLKVIPK